MTDIIKMRDSIKTDSSVYLRVKLAEGSFVDERSSWTFWDDDNYVLYSIQFPDNASVNDAYNYINKGVHVDVANYIRSLKADSRIFMVFAYTYDSIVGMQAVYDKSMVLDLMDAKSQPEEVKKSFKDACIRLNNPETFIKGGEANTDKDYQTNTMY